MPRAIDVLESAITEKAKRRASCVVVPQSLLHKWLRDSIESAGRELRGLHMHPARTAEAAAIAGRAFNTALLLLVREKAVRVDYRA